MKDNGWAVMNRIGSNRQSIGRARGGAQGEEARRLSSDATAEALDGSLVARDVVFFKALRAAVQSGAYNAFNSVRASRAGPDC